MLFPLKAISEYKSRSGFRISLVPGGHFPSLESCGIWGGQSSSGMPGSGWRALIVASWGFKLLCDDSESRMIRGGGRLFLVMVMALETASGC